MRLRLAAAVGALALAVFSGISGTPAAAAADRSTPAERLSTTTPIKHFVVLMQANHSFDNYFGTYSGADGIPKNTCMPLDPAKGATPCARPYHVGNQAITDMGQSSNTYAAQYDGGRMDGFVSAFAQRGNVGNQPMGYYDSRDIPFYWNVADDYVLFDRLFTSAAGGSVWNHMFWISGGPGNPWADALTPTGFDAFPTIFDSLQQRGVSWKFYVQDYRPEVTFRSPGQGQESAQLVRVPLLDYNRFLDDPALHSRIVDMSQYYKDLAAGTLPAVSFMVPAGNGEHPPASVQAGERFVQSLVNALTASSAWRSSAFMWTYDDWGGWYDHVTPPSVDHYGYGFRSPALLVSPYAKKGYVDHTTLDFTSELKFIENNWGVPPLAARDEAASNITSAFDFASGPRPAALLGRARGVAAPPPAPSGRIYLSYGAALLGLLLLVAVARRLGVARQASHRQPRGATR